MRFVKIAEWKKYRGKITTRQQRDDPEVWRPRESSPCDGMAEYRFRYLTLTRTGASGNTRMRTRPGQSTSTGTSVKCARYVGALGATVDHRATGVGRSICFRNVAGAESRLPGSSAAILEARSLCCRYN